MGFMPRFVMMLLLVAAAIAPGGASAANAADAEARAPEATPGGALTVPGASSYDQLAERLARRIDRQDWHGGRLAILVRDAELPIEVFARGADQPMTPGALQQWVTAAAAIERLGADFRFHTELRRGGAAGDKHAWKGPLIVVGDGDPTIGRLAEGKSAWRLFDDWARVLKKQGMKRIEGMLIGDGRAFAPPAEAPGWPVERRGDPRQPPVSAINFNENCIELTFKTGDEPGEPAELRILPELPEYIFFGNRVRMVPRPVQPLRIERAGEGNVIAARGDLGPETRVEARATVADPPRYFAEALRARLARRGIEVEGKAYDAAELSPGEIPRDSELLARHDSPPLSQMLPVILREQSTLGAEVLLRAMAREGGAPGSAPRPANFELGARAVGDWLAALRLPDAPPVVVDGSGQSPLNRITAGQLLGVMRAARKGGVETWEAWLPRAGGDGVLRERFQRPGAQAGDGDANQEDAGEEARKAAPPEVWALAASDEELEGLAGWVRTRQGRTLLFVMMLDGTRLPAPTRQRLFDSLVREMAATGFDRP